MMESKYQELAALSSAIENIPLHLSHRRVPDLLEIEYLSLLQDIAHDRGLKNLAERFKDQRLGLIKQLETT
jgi:hypothetical protein